MNHNWAEVRQQMDQVLELERAQRRAQRQVRRRQQPSFIQALRTRWQAIMAVFDRQSPHYTDDSRHSTPLHRWTTH